MGYEVRTDATIIQKRERDRFKFLSMHAEKPWCGLKPHPDLPYVYQADVSPLSPSAVETTFSKLAQGTKKELKGIFHEVRDANRELLDQVQAVIIVLDGRAESSATQGYLGDMIEASRLVSSLQSDLRTIIATPHIDLFEGKNDGNVELLPIPKEIPGSQSFPWNNNLRRFLAKRLPGIPCLFPINAKNIVLAELNKDGSIKNTALMEKVKEATRPQAPDYGLPHTLWWKRGLHQLQALQILAVELGLPDAKKWAQFPEAYLWPSKASHEIAAEVQAKYGIADATTGKKKPVLLHTGVATNGRKEFAKYYPPFKWQAVLNELASDNLLISEYIMFAPVEDNQAKQCNELVIKLRHRGHEITAIPTKELKDSYGWNLGHFIALLERFSQSDGIIVGCDSMPAGHAAPAKGIPSVVLASIPYNPGFYCPATKANVVMPYFGDYTKSVQPKHVAAAVEE
jgi:hypothetical protein